MDKIKNIYRKNYREIIEFAQYVNEIWKDRIIRHFGDESFKNMEARKYLAPEGGYRIMISQLDDMDAELRTFFKGKMKRQHQFVYFRGYDYYVNDKCIHRKKHKMDNAKALALIEKRWKEYRNNIHLIKHMQSVELKWVNYLAILSYLEWIWNDLSSLSWIVLFMKDEMFEFEFMKNVDMLASVIVNCTYGLLCENSNIDFEKEEEKLAVVLSQNSEKINFNKIANYICEKEEYIFRTIREGDQFWIVLANYEFKFLPWIKYNDYKKIMVMNNAFGAINLGYFIKHCCKKQVDVVNIYSSVHEEQMNRYNFIHNVYLKGICDFYEKVIIVDDSIFTGRSLQGIKDSIGGDVNRIVCLPMTYDVSTYFNHPEEMDFDNAPLDSVMNVEQEVRNMGGLLTPARSYWAYKKLTHYSTDDVEYEKNIKGSDLLIRILWRRFEKEIKKEYD